MKYDENFLLKLDKQKNKTIYARITSLSQSEQPIETLEGRITGGSINIDGASAVRRTCSVTLVGQDLKITDYYWSFKQKFKLEIGVQNQIDTNYPEIIWFKQGIYLISSFSHSQSTNGINISIQGKDKMAKLDGTMGGTLTAQTDFGSYDEIAADGTITNIKIPLFKIVQNMLYELVGEPYHNIIVNDLEEYGYELWDYRGDNESPMYYFYELDENNNITNNIINLTFDENKKVKDENGNIIALKDIPQSNLYNQNKLNAIFIPYFLKNRSYAIAKIENGNTAGYHKTNLVYAGELKANAGETLVSVLDKIKNMLGEFEYFYDLDGKFVFQKKRTYVSNLFSPLQGSYVEPFATMEKYSYKFDNMELIINCSDNPVIGEVKNDFVIWGVNSSNNSIHARFAIDHKPTVYKSFPYYKRVYLTYLQDSTDEAAASYVKVKNGYDLSTNQAIGIKKIKTPLKIDNEILYEEDGDNLRIFDINKQLYIKNENYEFIEIDAPEDIVENYYIIDEESKEYQVSTQVDWRELIYLMARDYYQHHENPNYALELEANNPWCKNGKTGYEQYYADLQSFWQLLYKRNVEKEYQEVYSTNKNSLGDNNYIGIGIIETLPEDKEQLENIYYVVERERQMDGEIETYYCLKRYIDEKNNTVKKYYQLYANSIYTKSVDLDSTLINNNLTIPIITMVEKEEKISNYNLQVYALDSNYITDKQNEYYQWSKIALYSPEQLIFWFDFLDTRGELDNFSVPSIGVRTKVDNNQSIKTIYNKEVPEVEFIVFPKEVVNINSSLALSRMIIQDTTEELFNISSSGLSAAARADELINQYACIINSISLISVPIYYLEPNTRIYVKNDDLKIDGDYLVSKITIPLTYNGTMNISATKVIKQIN